MSKAKSPTEEKLRDEIRRLHKEMKSLKAQLKYSEMARDAYNCMIDLAEQEFNIPILVQAVTQREQKYTVRSLCELFGISRQGYYKHQEQKSEMDILSSSVVLYCKAVREHDNLPRAGCRELCELCRKHFREKFTMGRDQFYNLLRSNDLMLRRRRYRPRTTNSNHNYKLYEDLLNTTPKLRPSRNGELVVSDITYVYVKEGFAYLSLITDAFS